MKKHSFINQSLRKYFDLAIDFLRFSAYNIHMNNKKTDKKAARLTSIRNRILGAAAARLTSIRNRILGAAQTKSARLTSIRNRILGADLNLNFLI
mgnify:CR=1 FL=1